MKNIYRIIGAILIHVVFFTISLYGQAPSIQWEKSLGGAGGVQINSMEQTSDGGYVVAGTSNATNGKMTSNHGGSNDYWIVKLSSDRNIEWQKLYGGSGDDEATSVQQTNDGGYILAGISYSTDGDVTGNHGSGDYWVVKLDSLGNLEWQKSLGGTGDEEANAIEQTSDGGYIVAGMSHSVNGDVTGHHGDSTTLDYWIVKLNSIGNIQWEKSLGGSGNDQAYSVQQTNDGGYVIAGFDNSNDGDVTSSHGNEDYWIVKIDSIGKIEWQKSYGGGGDEEAYSVQQTKDSGYIVAGWTHSSDGDVTGQHGYNSDCWILKLSFNGNLEWQKTLGGSEDDAAYSIQQTIDGGYIFAGSSNSDNGDVTGNHGSGDYWVVKLDSSGTIEWQKAIGGSYGDYACSIRQTIDGYVVAGESNSIDGDIERNHSIYLHCWLIGLSDTGAIEWQKALGGGGNDVATSIKQTFDDGYIVAGWSSSTDGDVTANHGGYDEWIVKLDSTGELDWQKTLGGSDHDEAKCIQQTNDSGFIVAGFSYSLDGDVAGNHGNQDYWIVKLSNAGTIQWQKSLGGSGDDEANAIQQTIDGGYIVAGWSNSTDGDIIDNHGNYDYWIVKLDFNGGILWKKSFGGSGNDKATSIYQTKDKGYVIAGYSNSNNDNVTGHHGNSFYSDYWIVKVDSVGNIQWQKSLGGTEEDEAYSIQQTNDSGYVVAGSSYSNDGDVTGHHGSSSSQQVAFSDYWIVKLDTIGNIQWQKSYGGNSVDEAYSVQQVGDGGYIVAGYSASIDGDVSENHGPYNYPDYWVIKINVVGNIVWQKALGGAGYDIATSIGETKDGGCILSGYSDSQDGDVTGYHGNPNYGGGDYDYWIVKLSPIADAVNEKPANTPAQLSLTQNYPNPFSGMTNIEYGIPNEEHVTLKVYNALGEEVATLVNGNVTAGTHNVTFDSSGLPGGVYFYKVSAGESILMNKMFIVR
jgi:hypothetical protein